MPLTVWTALIAAAAALIAAGLGFFGRILIDGPTSKGTLLMQELEWYSTQVPKLRDELEAIRSQLSDERLKNAKELSEARAHHLIELAERDAVIASLSVRVSELERREMTPKQREADLRRQQSILDKPDRAGGD